MNLYRVPAVRFEAKIVYTNNPPGGAYRGYGNPQGTIALETAMDALAAELGMDAVELRLKNAPRPDSLSNLSQKITTCGAVDCLQAVAGRLDFSVRRSTAPVAVDGRIRAVGLASAVNVGGGARDLGDNDGCGAFVKVEDDGGVMLLTGGQEIGTGGSTMMAQVVSQELGVPMARIQVLNNDTDVMPWDIGCHAQRNAFVTGHAARLAAQDARVQLFQQASEMLEAAPADLVAKDSRIYAQGAPGRSVGLAEAVQALHYRTGGAAILGKGYYDPPTVPTDPRGKGNKSATYSYACHGVEIEVELDTGRVTVLRVVAAHDCGTAINPMDVEGQIEGGVAQAMGWALTEELVWREGRTLNADLLDYKVLTPMDVPDIEVVLIETADPEGPYGAKGVAEISIVPTAAAIANALNYALGARLRTLPFSPDKVLDATGAISLGAA
jgi:xanthine dehydrogenase molybdenum-binding subunit